MSHFRKFIDRAERVEGVLSALGAAASGISIVGLVLLITVYVIGRKFGLTLLFVEEWGGYLLVLITYMGAAYALSKDAHVQMRLVLDNVPVRVRMLLSVFFALAGIPLIGFLLWLSISRVIGCIKVGSRSLYYMETPLWIPSIFISIGLVLLLLAVVMYFVRAIRALMIETQEKEKEEVTSDEIA